MKNPGQITLDEAALTAHMSSYTLKTWARRGAFTCQPQEDGSTLVDEQQFLRWLNQLPPLRSELDPSKRWYSAAEIAEITGLTKAQIYKDIDAGYLKSRLCRERIPTYVVEESELNRWLRAGSHKQAAPEKESQEDLWPLPRAAKFVGLRYELLAHAADSGQLPTQEIPHFFLGMRRVVDPAELIRWLSQQSKPYRKEAAGLPAVADLSEAARRSRLPVQRIRQSIREGELPAWENLIPRRALDLWLKKLGLPESWQQPTEPVAKAPAGKPVASKTVPPKASRGVGELLSLANVTQRLGVPRHALMAAVENGTLPAQQKGQGWLVEQSDLQKWMDERSKI